MTGSLFELRIVRVYECSPAHVPDEPLIDRLEGFDVDVGVSPDLTAHQPHCRPRGRWLDWTVDVDDRDRAEALRDAAIGAACE